MVVGICKEEIYEYNHPLNCCGEHAILKPWIVLWKIHLNTVDLPIKNIYIVIIERHIVGGLFWILVFDFEYTELLFARKWSRRPLCPS